MSPAWAVRVGVVGRFAITIDVGMGVRGAPFACPTGSHFGDHWCSMRARYRPGPANPQRRPDAGRLASAKGTARAVTAVC